MNAIHIDVKWMLFETQFGLHGSFVELELDVVLKHTFIGISCLFIVAVAVAALLLRHCFTLNTLSDLDSSGIVHPFYTHLGFNSDWQG